MKKKCDSLKFKLAVSSVLLGMMSVQAHALPNAPGKAHHPIHYKPNTPHILPSGLTPNQVSHAYGFALLSTHGEGQVIAIVDAFDDPYIESDLGVFNKRFGLPTCTTKNGCFKKIYASGRKPKTDAGWSGEIALDVEWAHAMAPKAKIILVEAASDSLNDLFQAVQVAVKSGATVVSMSWGGGEFSEETQFDSYFNNPNVTFTASSGDNGTGPSYPAASPYVLAVGGTTLHVDSYGNYQGESAWSGSGGGISTIEAMPAGQSSFSIPQANNMRGIPDVSYNADPETGFSVYNTVPGDGGTGWSVVGGTSAGAPQWAAIVAVANSQLKAQLGKNLGGNFANLLYSAANPQTGNYSSDFNDITDGSNDNTGGSCQDVCSAVGGYDFVTGLGSPELGNLIGDLPNYLMAQLVPANSPILDLIS
ncbi:Pseudomonalisin precursor [Legionella massiliensis]|uniref:Pseudomonalisin n=1 Tax=Legionella massiliensis TaxID=1034943 RepID=A0A078L0Y2_9GAMM|nr:S53 family peptidase [Legionella massiliensis]CDZ77713.1 Pseudomonalisin precursor [Legionella massiliensis]CEE13451.1 Pseudomonalisin precursor [Legionella massiliensis]